MSANNSTSNFYNSNEIATGKTKDSVSFCAESFVFQVSIEKFKDQNI